MSLSLLSGALFAGLIGSPHCVAMCGGLAGAGATRRREGIAWHVGRLGTYATLGALAGAFGRALPGPAWVPLALSAGFLLFFALRLGGWMPVVGGPSAHRLSMLAGRALRLGGWPGRLAFGAVTGLLPCGLVYAALSMPVASGDPLGGALAMVLFGLGTVPALAAATSGLRRLSDRSLATRRLMAGLVFVSGVGALLWRAPALHGSSADALPPCHQAPAGLP